jgi:hypothetical protein
MPVLRPATAPASTASSSLRLLTRVCWVLLGAVFIFSGFIKLNDPVGTAYKLEEYFEVFALDVPWAAGFFDFLKNQSRFLSIFLSSLEVMLGVALLLRWYLRQTLGVLLALLVFFGFLTFYSAAFNKVTDCGCFGDFIKLTPWTSFGKDMFLLVLWGVVFLNRRFLRHSFLRGTAGLMGMTVASAIAIGIGVRALGHLPYFDFLPYKVGNNIAKEMKPAEAPRYRYTFERDGKTMESETFPTDSTWKYKSMTVLNPEKSKAAITDFSVTDPEGNNITEQVLKGNKLLILIQNTNKADRDRFTQLNQLIAEATKSRKHIDVLAITSTSAGKFDSFRHEVNLMAPFAFADATVLKTMIRSNPGLMVLENGTVMAKYHYHDIPALYQIEKAL